MDTAPSHVMCARCGTVWTPIKFGSEGPVCPKCNVAIGPNPQAAPVGGPTESVPVVPAATTVEIAESAVPVSLEPPASPVLPLRTPKRGPHLSPLPISVDDPVDDDGYYSSRRKARDLEPDETSAYEPRRGMHPLLKLMLILILLVVLTPVVVVVLLFAVCAVIAAFGR